VRAPGTKTTLAGSKQTYTHIPQTANPKKDKVFSYPAANNLVARHLGCTILETEGDDMLAGTTEDDVIYGLGGNDTIDGQQGADTIRGNAGADTIYNEQGVDVMLGVASEDTVISQP